MRASISRAVRNCGHFRKIAEVVKLPGTFRFGADPMNKTEETEPSGQRRESSEDSEPDAEGKEAGLEDGVPLSVRRARKMRKDLWPSIWLTFASVIILAAALAIMAYRMGAQSCR
jgi:hypothetical protein